MTTLILIPSPIEWNILTGVPPKSDLASTEPIFTLSRGNCVWALCGIGPASAAMTASILISRLQPARVILAGIAGAFPQSQLETGAIVQVSEECFADLGYENGGQWFNLDKMNLPMLPLAGRSLGCSHPLRLLDENQPHASAITVSTVTSSHERADALWRNYRAGLENMEGAAIAMVCALFNMPFHEIRAVSNLVGPRDPASWQVRGPLQELGEWLTQRL